MPAAKQPSPPTRSPVYVIFGNENFLRRCALESVLASVLGDDRDQMAIVDFEGDKADLKDVLDECRTPSLLAPVRLIIVSDADDFVTKYRKELENYVQSPSPSGSLVLVVKSWPRTTRLFKLVDAIGGNIACETPKDQALVPWTIDRARASYQCKLDENAARRLVDYVGAQLGLIDMELSKLATYILPRKEISEADVEEMVGVSRVEVVFRIVDFVAQGDARGAMNLWDQVIANDKEAEFKAIGGLAFAFRRLIDAKRLVDQGLSPFDAARRLGIWKAERLGEQLRRFTLPQWQDHLARLLKIEVNRKTDMGTVRMGVEKLIIQLCSTRKSA